jgi:hypothetical protein
MRYCSLCGAPPAIAIHLKPLQVTRWKLKCDATSLLQEFVRRYNVLCFRCTIAVKVSGVPRMSHVQLLGQNTSGAVLHAGPGWPGSVCCRPFVVNKAWGCGPFVRNQVWGCRPFVLNEARGCGPFVLHEAWGCGPLAPHPLCCYVFSCSLGLLCACLFSCIPSFRHVTQESFWVCQGTPAHV